MELHNYVTGATYGQKPTPVSTDDVSTPYCTYCNNDTDECYCDEEELEELEEIDEIDEPWID